MSGDIAILGSLEDANASWKAGVRLGNLAKASLDEKNLDRIGPQGLGPLDGLSGGEAGWIHPLKQAARQVIWKSAEKGVNAR